MAIKRKLSSTQFFLWEFPDVLLFHICSFVAAPTERVTVLCHQLACINKSFRKAILEEESSSLWSIVLQQDYGVLLRRCGTQQRSSKRLKQSQLQRVCAAHKLIRDNTEIAYYYLTELCTSKNPGISRRRICGILDEYGPHLRLNHTTKTGGTFLVEITRARHVKESTILQCVKELVENRGVWIDLQTNEYQWNLTALSVASARGMPSVVKYLLEKNARADVQCSGRFRLFSNNRKTITCRNATALEFALKMNTSEILEGASKDDVKDLNKVIRLLRNQKKYKY